MIYGKSLYNEQIAVFIWRFDMDDPNAYILKQYLDKVDRKLEDYTLKEVKQVCRQQLDCPDCPFYNEEFDCCLLVDKIPDSWEL